jgi:hypothetical protein
MSQIVPTSSHAQNLTGQTVNYFGPVLQGHLVFKFNTNESQGLRWLGRQPAAGGGNVGMARPP